MSGFLLKCIGILTMTIDHVGAIWFPQVEWLRWVGRLAFPIFCFFLVEGWDKTRDRRNYLLRLLMFAVLSEIPFQWGIHQRVGFYGQNVLFTLLLGAVAMILWEIGQKGNRWVSIFGIAGICLLAEFLQTDYASFGVLMILGYFVFQGNFRRQALVMTVLTIGFALSGRMWVGEIAALVALLPLYRYNGQRGRGMKYFFYVFYPVHLLLLRAVGPWLFS